MAGNVLLEAPGGKEWTLRATMQFIVEQQASITAKLDRVAERQAEFDERQAYPDRRHIEFEGECPATR